MKKYNQLLNEMPSKTVVFAFGRFQPPTTGHELLVNAVARLAQQKRADHVIIASKTQDKKKNPLTVERKVHYLRMMFPRINFMAANPDVRTFIEAAKMLNKKYKNIVMVAGSDRVQEFTTLLNRYNGKDFKFDSIEVISAGKRDPDSDSADGMSGTKMRQAAEKGNYVEFKKGLPSRMRDIDGRRLMNDIRMGLGMQAVREQVTFKTDDLREQYFQGKIYNIGDTVEDYDGVYQIVNRGSNHILVQEENGELVSKWIHDVKPTEREFMLNEALSNKTLKSADKIKVGRVIATMLGVDNAEAMSNPTQMVNMGLRNIKKKALNAAALELIKKMIDLAKSMDIDYDKNLVPQKIKEAVIQPNGTDKIPVQTGSDSTVVVNKNSKRNAAKDVLRFSDFKKLQKVQEQDEDLDDEFEDAPPQTEVGGLMSPPYNTTDDNLRRRKVNYMRNEQTEGSEAAMKRAQKEKARAQLQIKQSKEKESLRARQEREREQLKNEEVESLEENKAVKNKAEKSGVSYGTLMKVYRRGVAAWNSGHRPGTTPEQWGLARVNSYINKGKGTYHGADKDLREETLDEKMKSVPKDKDTGLAKKYVAGLSKSTAAARKAHWDKADKLSDRDPEAYKPAPGDATAKTKPSKHTIAFKKKFGEACWDNYKQVGMKKKGDKMVPDCVPEDNQAKRLMSPLQKIRMDKEKADRAEKEAPKRSAGTGLKKESTDAYGKSVQAIADKKKKDAITDADKDKLAKLHKMMQTANEETAKTAMSTGHGPVVDVDDVTASINPPHEETFDNHDVKEGEWDDNASEYAKQIDILDFGDDRDLEQMVNAMTDDEIIELAYEDDEVEEVDEETGEPVELDDEEKELQESLNLIEGLSRMERIKARQRLKRTAAKRKRSTKIAMKRISSTKTANARARRAAIKKLKQRMLRGRNPSQLSVGEKERVEKFVAGKKNLINRLAMKMLPRVRQIEKKRLANARKKR